ncbi:ABC transporter permease [Caproicibacter sp.]|uniref:ABC transporter permease n=1 Tax=Caproicibacter sp. TaxID=2814884 RepID=UPI00398A2F7E
MVRGALWKKTIRDMKQSKSQFISILIMATLAVSIVTGLDSIWFTIQKHADAMYRSTSLSDLWVTVANPSERQLWGIKQIDGVTRVEQRYCTDADTDLPGNPTLRVYALDDRSTLDQPDVQEGSFEKYGGGAVLDENFAESNGLKIGDVVSIKLNGAWVRVPITGLGLSSEQIFAVKNSASLMPDSKSFGFLVVHAGTMESVYGRKVYNQVSVRLASGTDVSQVERQADAVIGKELIGIVSQKDSSSVNSVDSRIQQFRTLGIVFPLLFFIVTALITQSTMVRLVENQRGQIGILKALGYSRRSILWHYTSYGVVIGLFGSLLGLVIGPNAFGRVLVPRVKLTFSDYRLSINFGHFFLAMALILICTGGVSFYACRKLQGDTPAVLLRDRPPKKGNHIFLESIPSLWRKLKFSSKLIARNTMKNKGRLMMSTVGVMGCTGAILAALTIRSMISGITVQMYGTTFNYDQKILVDQTKTDTRYLANQELNGIVQQTEESNIELICPDGERKMEPLTITSKNSPLIHLQDVSGNPVSIPESGIAVSRKLTETLGVKPGDSIQIKRTDQKYVTVPVTQVFYLASGQGIFMSDAYWKSLGETFKPTALLVKWNGAPNEKFLSSDAVEESVTRESQRSGLSGSTQVVNIAVAMMIVMGAALAFVVLYNTSILNFTERIRDLATLRVLGFYHGEIRNLVLIENYFSVCLGMIFGIPVGRSISWIVAKNLDSRLDLFGTITPQNVLIAGILTLFFAWIINRAVAKKMKNLDMLSALKSVE